MTTRRSARDAASQLELPLPPSSTTTGPGQPSRTRPGASRGSPRRSTSRTPARARRTTTTIARSGPVADDGVRLDEQTRIIGRQGIAAARALLGAATLPDDQRHESPRSGGAPGSTSCAA